MHTTFAVHGANKSTEYGYLDLTAEQVENWISHEGADGMAVAREVLTKEQRDDLGIRPGARVTIS